MVKCKVCGKEIEEPKFAGYVNYSSKMEETYLCRGHYLKWCKFHKPYSNQHKNVKPCTKEWIKMCNEESKLFMQWLKEQMEVSLK